MADLLARLVARRQDLYAELSRTGDFRRGTLTIVYRRCGKPSCRCRQPGQAGHGPQHLLTTRVAGRGRSRSVHPGAELRRVAAQIDNHRRFRTLVRELVEVNERICEARLQLNRP